MLTNAEVATIRNHTRICKRIGLGTRFLLSKFDR